MKLLVEKKLSKEDICPYIKTEKITQEYFFATDVLKDEYQKLLEVGWRRFGIFYFNYECKSCSKCKPIRVDINNFKLSKSQRKVVRKNRNTKVIIKNLEPREEIFKIYQKHSLEKFNDKVTLEQFMQNFYYKNNFALQSEYYINEKLVGIGFIDRVDNALSSIYFAYDTNYSDYSLGTYSVIYELNYAKKEKLSYYYLGYLINENSSMKYKSRFKVNQIYRKDLNIWINGS